MTGKKLYLVCSIAAASVGLLLLLDELASAELSSKGGDNSKINHINRDVLYKTNGDLIHV